MCQLANGKGVTHKLSIHMFVWVLFTSYCIMGNSCIGDFEQLQKRELRNMPKKINLHIKLH